MSEPTATTPAIPVTRRLAYYLEYLPLVWGLLLFRLLPWRVACARGRILGRLFSFLPTRRYRITIDNLTKVFPEKPAGEITAIARACWGNIGRIAAEFIKLTDHDRAYLFEHCRVENDGLFKARLDSGKGAIVHIGHFTNWEAAGLALTASGYDTVALTRITRNPYVDALVRARRMKFGGELIGHRNPFFSCVKTIKRGKAIIIASDQNMPAGELFMPFFGRICAVSPLTALLSLKTHTPVFPLHVLRDEKGVIVARFEDPVLPPEHYTEEGVLETVRLLNKITEGWIRANPGMWLWSHNRWKRENDPRRFAKPENKLV
ncbi:MAG: lysophospholipid acyltransferase family protein [Elusimicrobiaceae bacterium]|nr:lysophospholipid acyltransferase family protein [Elusimicrobiaceae bacterium]